MKLLFDQNLSPCLPRVLTDIYPESIHVREINLRDGTCQRERCDPVASYPLQKL